MPKAYPRLIPSEFNVLYPISLQHNEAFWLKMAEHLDWFKQPTQACKQTWNSKERQIEHTWFEDGQLNVSYNCLDCHLPLYRDKTAIIWQGDEEDEVRELTFGELHTQVCRFANVLKTHGIQKGDRVCIYMPMVPEAAIAMLACARIGAVHSVVFAGFSAESLMHRLNDAACKLLVTANSSVRGGKHIPLKDIADKALTQAPSVQTVVVFRRNRDTCTMQAGRDVWYDEEMIKASPECEPEVLNAEDPLFILYTSGSTGKPKGVVHTQAGYLLYASFTHQSIFDIQHDDIYWSTADVGWITGHSYVVYGPLANATTTLLFEGAPLYPNPGRFWQIIDRFKVTVFYTAPTVIRSLIAQGNQWPEPYSLQSLRILGSVGEPINPEAWIWFDDHIGKNRCPIMDTWWQTETGGIMISPSPFQHSFKPGCAGLPFYGVEPVILKEDGTECQLGESGSLCIKHPTPGMMRTMWGDHDRFIDTYFSTYKDVYFTGDGCRQDEDGEYWLLGRVDDVVNISGHRIGTAEVESAFVTHALVSEAAVVPIPHEIKGQGLCVYVVLIQGVEAPMELKQELIELVRKEIGPIATPDRIHIARSLPRTRSGKIMRRILRKIAEGSFDQLGDLSTLADPSVVEEIILEVKSHLFPKNS